jgi:hypothetical protein
MINRISKLSSYLGDINKCNSETKDISIQILEQLEKQEQSLIQTNNNLNKSNDLIDTSNKVLDTMSWSGWVLSFVPFRRFFSKIFTRKTHEKQLFITNEPFNVSEINYNEILVNEIIDNEEEREKLLKINKYYENNMRTTIELSPQENAELLKLEMELSELLWIGSKIGEHLDLHNNYIDTINEKTQIVSKKTKNINKKTIGFL